MTVAELIEFLKTQPQDLPVAYDLLSEQCMLEVADIKVRNLCDARHDGWIHDERPDKPARPYLVFPGN